MDEELNADQFVSPAVKRRKRGKASLTRAKAIASMSLVVGTSIIAVGATGSPASAHARCDGVSHNDWHTIAFHYDRHTFTRYEYSQHYHFWSGSYHTHTHVRFRNTTHGYDYFTANC